MAPLAWVAVSVIWMVRLPSTHPAFVTNVVVSDASVTQSALEEALASRMQDGTGTIGSRMSTFSQAIRSRYLPKGGNPQQGNNQP